MKGAAQAIGEWRRLRAKLVAARNETVLSQDAIADLVGVCRETVGRWERGEREPKAAELFLWAAALDVTIGAAP